MSGSTVNEEYKDKQIETENNVMHFKDEALLMADFQPRTRNDILKVLKLNFLDFFEYINIETKQSSRFGKHLKTLNEIHNEELLVFLFIMQIDTTIMYEKIYQPDKEQDSHSQTIYKAMKKFA